MQYRCRCGHADELQLVFTGKTLSRYLHVDSSGSEIGKDTVCPFLNSVNVNWRKFPDLHCVTDLDKKILPLTSIDTAKVFIVDDPLYNRNWSKNVELLARVHDHNDHRCIVVCGDVTKGCGIMGCLFQFAAGEYPSCVAIEQPD